MPNRKSRGLSLRGLAPKPSTAARLSAQSADELQAACAEIVSSTEATVGRRVVSDPEPAKQRTSKRATQIIGAPQPLSSDRNWSDVANDPPFETDDSPTADRWSKPSANRQRQRESAAAACGSNEATGVRTHSAGLASKDLTPSPLFSRQRPEDLPSRIPVARHIPKPPVKARTPLAATSGNATRKPRVDKASKSYDNEDQQELARLKSQVAQACQQIEKLESHLEQRAVSKPREPRLAHPRDSVTRQAKESHSRPFSYSQPRAPSRLAFRATSRTRRYEPSRRENEIVAGWKVYSEDDVVDSVRSSGQAYDSGTPHQRRSVFILPQQHHRDQSNCTIGSAFSEETIDYEVTGGTLEQISSPNRSIRSYEVYQNQRCSSVTTSTSTRFSGVLSYAQPMRSRKVQVAVVDVKATPLQNQEEDSATLPGSSAHSDIPFSTSSSWVERFIGPEPTDIEHQTPLNRYLTSIADVSFNSISEKSTSGTLSRDGVQLPSTSQSSIAPASVQDMRPPVMPPAAPRHLRIFPANGIGSTRPEVPERPASPPAVWLDTVDVQIHEGNSHLVSRRPPANTIRYIASSKEASTNSLPTLREVSSPTVPAHDSSPTQSHLPLKSHPPEPLLVPQESATGTVPETKKPRPRLLPSMHFSARPRRKIKALFRKVMSRREVKNDQIEVSHEQPASSRHEVVLCSKKDDMTATATNTIAVPPRSSGMDSTLHFEQYILKQIGRLPSQGGRARSKRSSVVSLASAAARTTRPLYGESIVPTIRHSFAQHSVSHGFAPPGNTTAAPGSPTRRPRAAMASRSPTKRPRRRYPSRHRATSTAVSDFSFGSGPSLSLAINPVSVKAPF